MHVFEDRFRSPPTATFKPPHAPADAYRDGAAGARPEPRRRRPADRLRLRQPLHARRAGRARAGSARASSSSRRARATAELARLDALGVRGVRYMMLPGGVLGWASLERTAAAIAPLGWHIDLQLDGRDLPRARSDAARACRAALAIDHIGKFLGPTSTESERPSRALPAARPRPLLDQAVGAVRELEERPARLRRHRAARPLLAERYPERCLWASNWPHPNTLRCPRSRRCSTGPTAASATRRTGRRSWSTTRPRSTASERRRRPHCTT